MPLGWLAAEARARVRLVRLLPLAGWPLLLGLVALFGVTSLLPAASALAAGLLVGRVVTAMGAADPAGMIGFVLPAVAALGGVLVLGQVAEAADKPISMAAVSRIDGHVRRRIRALALGPAGIAHLENAAVQDDVALASEGWMGFTPGRGAVGQLWLAFRVAGAIAAAAVLAGFSWLFAVLLLAMMVAVRAMLRRQWLALAASISQQSGNTRRVGYWAEVAVGPAAAKEIRVFGLGGWAIDRHEQQALATLREVWRQRRRVMLGQPWVAAVTVAAGVLALVAPTAAALSGDIGAGELAAYLRASAGVFALGSLGMEAYAIEYSRPVLDALDRLRQRLAPARAPAHTPAPNERRDAHMPPAGRAPSIEFDGVGFTYPGTERAVLTGLDLRVHPGEVLAIVGVNGAGKTTLIKLLAGLYRPDRGRILVDGANLAESDPQQWRRRLSVVFQDFVHYELPARDNVGLGAPQHIADLAELEAAAEQAGARPLLRDLPAGWDTPLSRAYPGGTDLSGGQWQHIALARALFAVRAGGQVLVLDEPTAHLDIRAELAVFDRIVGGLPGVSVILISHRLSTVRRADRIVLLDGGRIVEEGTHDELMAGGGRYAELFTLQATRFR